MLVHLGVTNSRQNSRRTGSHRSRKKLLFHYPLFLPGENDAARQTQFLKSYIQLTDWMLAARDQKLRQRVAESRKAMRAAEKKFHRTHAALAVLRETLDRADDASFDMQDARKRLFATGLNKDELLELFDRSTRPPSPTEKLKHADDAVELAAQEQQLKEHRRAARKIEQHLRDDRCILDALSRLFDSAVKLDDRDAAKALHAAAQSSCAFLGFLSKQKPQLVRPIARISQTWPLLLGAEPRSLAKAQSKLEALELGVDTIYGRMRLNRAFNEQTPARAYARLLVETIWTNRLLLPELSERVQAMQEMDPRYTFDFEDLPSWLMSTARLPPFSTVSAPLWAGVARDMLRTESPEFHERPEWLSVRRAFGPREKGRVQNKILDKIASAMRTIARSDANETTTQNLLPKSSNRLRVRHL
jgi:hypothetical protein